MPRIGQWFGSAAEAVESSAPSAEHLEGFRRSQALAYDCATTVAAELGEGMTERQAAARMAEYLGDHGVRQFFHRPFAWFAERTALRGMRTELGFFPTKRKLEPGMPVILDVAPVVEGYTSDIGYACRLGDNPLHEQMLADLEPYRELILQGVRDGHTMRRIYVDVDRLIERQGYENRHHRYPEHVLAHKVNFVPEQARTQSAVMGFGPPALGYLVGKLWQANRGDAPEFPLWNMRRLSNQSASAGLWAVEPHLGFGDVGVKWEELLVVPREGEAYWLDDDLPHVRRFRDRSGRDSAVRAKAVA